MQSNCQPNSRTSPTSVRSGIHWAKMEAALTFCLASIFLAQLLCAHFSLTWAFSQAFLTNFCLALWSTSAGQYQRKHTSTTVIKTHNNAVCSRRNTAALRKRKECVSRLTPRKMAFLACSCFWLWRTDIKQVQLKTAFLTFLFFRSRLKKKKAVWQDICYVEMCRADHKGLSM